MKNNIENYLYRMIDDARIKTKSDLIVFKTIYSHVNPKYGVCFLSLNQILARCSLDSKTTVRRSITSLIEKGYIDKKNRVLDGEHTLSNSYKIKPL